MSDSGDLEIRKGAIGLAILALLSGKPCHGYELTRRLRMSTERSIRLSEGAIYPILHRFEQQGLVESYWGRTERNRKAKIYSLTPAGEQWLQRRTKQWFSLASVMNDILSSYVLSPKGAHP
ncbi:MAG: PadR family transcriptional regulator [Phycisphaerales bacterium JB058]|jgi:DNA-binding PadR family transcriptional regulator